MQNSQILDPNFRNARHGNTEVFQWRETVDWNSRRIQCKVEVIFAKFSYDVWGYSTQNWAHITLQVEIKILWSAIVHNFSSQLSFSEWNAILKCLNHKDQFTQLQVWTHSLLSLVFLIRLNNESYHLLSNSVWNCMD